MDALVEKITRKIAEAIRPDKIILFGSRARGAATDESDIDLVVVYSGPKSNREVAVDIDDLFMPRDFALDVFVMTPEELETRKLFISSLAREAVENGTVCYG